MLAKLVRNVVQIGGSTKSDDHDDGCAECNEGVIEQPEISENRSGKLRRAVYLSADDV